MVRILSKNEKEFITGKLKVSENYATNLEMKIFRKLEQLNEDIEDIVNSKFLTTRLLKSLSSLRNKLNANKKIFYKFF